MFPVWTITYAGTEQSAAAWGLNAQPRIRTRDRSPTEISFRMAGADPAALAALWSRLMDVAPDRADPLRLNLARGEIRFAQGEGPMTWITRVDLKVADPAAALDRARAAGLPVADGAVTIGGVGFRPVA